MKYISAVVLVSGLFLSACSYNLSPYTSHTQAQTNFNEEQLKKVQFYLQGDITLYRDYNNSETQITSGQIKIVNGQKVEQVVIKSGTPGVVIKAESADVFDVSFEQDGSFLRFGANPDYAGKYTMMAKQWEGSTGIVDYAGKEFKSTPESIYAYLTVNMNKINNSTIDSKQAGGRTIDR